MVVVALRQEARWTQSPALFRRQDLRRDGAVAHSIKSTTYPGTPIISIPVGPFQSLSGPLEPRKVQTRHEQEGTDLPPAKFTAQAVQLPCLVGCTMFGARHWIKPGDDMYMRFQLFPLPDASRVCSGNEHGCEVRLTQSPGVRYARKRSKTPLSSEIVPVEILGDSWVTTLRYLEVGGTVQ